MNRNLLILVAEDDLNDALLLKKAFEKSGIRNPVHISPNGQDAIAYLQGSGEYVDRERHPFPSVLITDLKMPLKTGFEVLVWLRGHPKCNVVPVLVLSASREEQDVRKAYELGANAYLVKPSTFNELMTLVRTIYDFWALCEKPPLREDCG
jgi:CheY-like chemotaxis protein